MEAKNVDCPHKVLEVRADVNTLLEELRRLSKPARPPSDPTNDRHTKHETRIIVRGK